MAWLPSELPLGKPSKNPGWKNSYGREMGYRGAIHMAFVKNRTGQDLESVGQTPVSRGPTQVVTPTQGVTSPAPLHSAFSCLVPQALLPPQSQSERERAALGVLGPLGCLPLPCALLSGCPLILLLLEGGFSQSPHLQGSMVTLAVDTRGSDGPESSLHN